MNYKKEVLKLLTIIVILAGIIGVLAQNNKLPYTTAVTRAVVFIGESPEDWYGSGVFISKQHVITAAHVLVAYFSSPVEPLNEIYTPYQPIPDITVHFKQANLPNLGDPVPITTIYSVKYIGHIVFIDYVKDIAILEIPDIEYPYHITLRPRIPTSNEELIYIGCVLATPIQCILKTVNPQFVLDWGVTKDHTTSQEMILTQHALVGGTSGGLILDKEGYGIAVHVGSIRPGFSIETPLITATDVMKFTQ